MAIHCNLDYDAIVQEMDFLRRARDDVQAEADDLTFKLESLGKLANALLVALESKAVENMQ